MATTYIIFKNSNECYCRDTEVGEIFKLIDIFSKYKTKGRVVRKYSRRLEELIYNWKSKACKSMNSMKEYSMLR